MNSDVVIIVFIFIAMLIVCGVDASRKRREYINRKEINEQTYSRYK
ncbi:MAG: hypothetical protein HYX49_01915 [Chloroflexi bacterium]|nr:hypothetical protein [Chloroflexota bacterium]